MQYLKYYTDEKTNQKDLKGTIDLKECVTLEKVGRTDIKIIMLTQARETLLRCPSEENQLEWYDVLDQIMKSNENPPDEEARIENPVFEGEGGTDKQQGTASPNAPKAARVSQNIDLGEGTVLIDVDLDVPSSMINPMMGAQPGKDYQWHSAASARTQHKMAGLSYSL
jgi:hypothetical protein